MVNSTVVNLISQCCVCVFVFSFAAQPIGLLDGIPISFKDNFSSRNVRTTCGSKMLANYSPPFNATVVERLLAQGGTMIGKTNMDEFAMGAACSESYFGPTYNPWNCGLNFKAQNSTQTLDVCNKSNDRNDWFIAGGSSGGSAVSVATGAAFAALSSDTGGSTRNPASRVGIVGFKPSYGLISRFGLIPLTHSLDVPGIMARNVADVRLVFRQLQALDKRDSTTVEKKLDAQPEVDISKLKIGIPEEYRCEFLDKTISNAWDEAIQVLERNGARIERISLPNTKYSLACYSILNTCEVASNFACYDGVEYGHRTSQSNLNFEDYYSTNREESLNDIVKSRIITGNYFLLNRNYNIYYRKALKQRRLIAEDFRTVFESVDFLLTPVTITSTMTYRKWNQLDCTEEAIKEDYCTQPVNMAGLPAISVPVGLDQRNLPIGLQLIANKFNDYRLLAFAEKFQNLFDFPSLLLE